MRGKERSRRTGRGSRGREMWKRNITARVLPKENGANY